MPRERWKSLYISWLLCLTHDKYRRDHFDMNIPGAGLEPARLASRDFKSLVSTISPPGQSSVSIIRKKDEEHSNFSPSPSSLFYYFFEYLIKNGWECYSNIRQHFSVEKDILFSHLSNEGTIFPSLFSNDSRKSFDPKFSKVSLLFFSIYISMLTLFYQCQSNLLIYLASSESKPFRKLDKFFMSSLSMKSIFYSNHLLLTIRK